mgnify:CR=1 FL=1
MSAKLSVITGSILLLSAPLQGFSATTHPDSCMNRDWKKEIPLPVYPNREMVDLYHKTWEIAAGRVRKGPEGLPASPYMDENCYEDQIWIWDTCFMVLFAKYAPRSFPGIESLDNLYKPIHEKAATPLRIHLVDNPPLFAWVEKEYFDFTGDKGRLNHLLNEKRYLQKHFKWFARAKAGERFECSPQRIYLNSIGDDGFTWTGGASGMDNTPRGRGCNGEMLWMDALAQQALAALYIERIAEVLDDPSTAKEFAGEYAVKKDLLNKYYWDAEDGFYYDIEEALSLIHI